MDPLPLHRHRDWYCDDASDLHSESLLVGEFVEITRCADIDAARAILEQAGWGLEQAVAAYMDTYVDIDMDMDMDMYFESDLAKMGEEQRHEGPTQGPNCASVALARSQLASLSEGTTSTTTTALPDRVCEGPGPAGAPRQQQAQERTMISTCGLRRSCEPPVSGPVAVTAPRQIMMAPAAAATTAADTVSFKDTLLDQFCKILSGDALRIESSSNLVNNTCTVKLSKRGLSGLVFDSCLQSCLGSCFCSNRYTGSTSAFSKVPTAHSLINENIRLWMQDFAVANAGQEQLVYTSKGSGWLALDAHNVSDIIFAIHESPSIKTLQITVADLLYKSPCDRLRQLETREAPSIPQLVRDLIHSLPVERLCVHERTLLGADSCKAFNDINQRGNASPVILLQDQLTAVFLEFIAVVSQCLYQSTSPRLETVEITFATELNPSMPLADIYVEEHNDSQGGPIAITDVHYVKPYRSMRLLSKIPTLRQLFKRSDTIGELLFEGRRYLVSKSLGVSQVPLVEIFGHHQMMWQQVFLKHIKQNMFDECMQEFDEIIAPLLTPQATVPRPQHERVVHLSTSDCSQHLMHVLRMIYVHYESSLPRNYYDDSSRLQMAMKTLLPEYFQFESATKRTCDQISS